MRRAAVAGAAQLRRSMARRIGDGVEMRRERLATDQHHQRSVVRRRCSASALPATILIRKSSSIDEQKSLRAGAHFDGRHRRSPGSQSSVGAASAIGPLP